MNFNIPTHRPHTFLLLILSLLIGTNSANAQALPCYESNPEFLWYNDLGSQFEIFTCTNQETYLWRHLPDGLLIPGCGEMNSGTLQYDIGTILENPYDGFTVCMNVPAGMQLLPESELTNVTTTNISMSNNPNEHHRTIICGEILYEGLALDQSYCNTLWLKYTGDPLFNSSYTSNAIFTIHDINDDPETDEACFSENVPVQSYLIGGTPPGIGGGNFFFFSSGDANWTELDANPSAPYLIIPDNTTLTFDVSGPAELNGQTVWFGANSEFIIPEGAQFTSLGVTFQGCSKWTGIKVENGASAEFQNSAITDAKTAINIKGTSEMIFNNGIITNCDVGIQTSNNTDIGISNSEISNVKNGIINYGPNYELALDNVIFEACSSNGLYSSGELNITTFQDNQFKNSPTGIRINSATKMVHLEAPENKEHPNYFINCNSGIRTAQSEVSVSRNIFNACSDGITMYSGSGVSSIIDNNIGYMNNGIFAVSTNFRARLNNIGIEEKNNIGRTGVTLIVCPFALIQDNEIKAVREGISSLYSTQSNFDLNKISIETDLANGIGINNFYSSNKISDNTILMPKGEAGILSNGASVEGNIIQNNDILFDSWNFNQSVGVKSTAAQNDAILYNHIQNSLSAVQMQNSTNGHIECNKIITLGKGIEVTPNSTFHQMVANSIFTLGKDISIQSVIGIQRFNGNLFNGNLFNGGEIEAIGLSNSEIHQSRFIIDPLFNSNIPLLPQVWNPSNLVDEQVDLQNETDDCDGTIGAPKVNDNPIELCKILESISAKSDAEQWINIYHIYRFYLNNYEFSSWPSCLQSYWNNDEVCGLKDLVQLETQLHSAIAGDSQWSTNLSREIENYSILMETAAIENFISTSRNTMNELSESYQTNLKAITEQQIIVVNQISCSLPLFDVWSTAYSQILKTILGQELTAEEKSDTEINAGLCAAEYGDGVNWSRGLAKSWSETRFDLAESCTTPFGQHRIQKSEALDISIQPNPSTGYVKFIGLEVNGDYNYDILTANGQLVNGNIVLTNEIADLSHLEDGIYFVKVVNLSNRLTTTIKIVIIN